jgi:hypothetical protein
VSGIAGRLARARRPGERVWAKTAAQYAGTGIHTHLIQRKSDAIKAFIARKLSTIKQLSR